VVNQNTPEFLNRHVPIPREAMEKFSAYHDLLIKWQAKINLVGPDTISSIWQRHFLDSLQISKFIENKQSSIIDIGTGAGFPGMALAIYGYENVHVVESDGKKVVFLKEVSRVTQTKIHIHHARVEKIQKINYDVIVSRACSELATLLQYSEPLVSHGTTLLFHKGKNYSREIEDALEKWLFSYEIFPSVADEHGVIVKLSKLERRAHDNQGSSRKT
jgi:16S rRNA (guanine527-N7)-methyltransferase